MTDAAGAGDGDGGVQLELTGLPVARAARRRRPPVADPAADHLPVALVAVERPQPHLDRPFEYLVPASLDEAARPGVRVRVRFGGQDLDGYLLARQAEAEHEGALVPLRRVVSPEVVLAPAVLTLARAVAQRYAGTVADVLRLAVPPRHARVEQEQASAATGGHGVVADARPVSGVAEGPGVPAPSEPAGAHEATATSEAPDWPAYTGGPAFLRRVADGGAPRAVWQALPGGPGDGHWSDAVAQAVAAARSGGRGALVVVPSAAEVLLVEQALGRAGVPAWRPGAADGWVRLVADDGPAARYRAFLAVSRGAARVVVGTRAAAFAPVRGLGLAVCWDDADHLHAEPRAPYPHTREVLALRSELEGCALLVGGYARSVTTQRWVGTGWAQPLTAPRETVRRRTPRIMALTSVELAREGAAAAARLPAPAWRAIRDGLTRGPVLVQVPRSGYLPSVACGTCRAMARCTACHGPLQVASSGGAPRCRWCGRLDAAWRCPECSGTALRSVRVGSDRTAEELGRAFPGVPVRVSGASAAGGVLAEVADRPALVVATPGAEPHAPGGYAAAVLLDAGVVTSRVGLDVPEQALRTWMAAAALVRPAGDGGLVQLVGDAAPGPTQALVRWDPAWLTERELAERAELSLPPAVHLVAVDGPRDAVEALLASLRLPDDVSVLGPLAVDPAPGSADEVPTLLDPETRRPVRALVRGPWSRAPLVTAAVAAALATRSARREPGGIRVHVEPLEVL